MSDQRLKRREPEDKTIIVLLGSKDAKKSFVGNQILKKGECFSDCKRCERNENEKFVVINTPDMFEGETPGQHVKECMALTSPGPHIVLLVLGNDTKTKEEVTTQVKQIMEMFGNEIEQYISVLTVLPPDHYDLNNLSRHTTNAIHLTELADNLGKLKRVGLHFIYKPKKTAYTDKYSNKDSHGHGAGKTSKHTFNHPCEKKDESQRASSSQNITRDTLNIVLLGQTGTGKSAGGNTILEKVVFTSRASSVPVTTECNVYTHDILGTQVTLIDTPDFWDESILNKELLKCRQLCQPGPSVYLLVLQVGRFTDGEREILDKLETAFESPIREKMIVLFTYGERLNESGMTPERFVSEADPHLQKIIEKCGGRYHVFKNKDLSDHQQRNDLIEMIRRIPGYYQLFPVPPKTTGRGCKLS